MLYPMVLPYFYDMRYWSGFVALFFLPIWVGGQTYHASLPIDFNLRSQAVEILGRTTDAIYVHVYDRREHTILNYHDNMGLKWSKTLPFDSRTIDLEHLIFDNGNFTGIFTERIKNERLVLARRYNNELQGDTTFFVLDTIDVRSGKSAQELFAILSQDKSRLAIYHVQEVFNSDDIFSYTIVDRNLNILGKGKTRIPTATRKSDLYEVLLDNHGNLHLIVGEYRDSGSEHLRRFRILSSSNNFEPTSESEVQAEEGKYLNNVRFKVDNFRGTLVGAGFYTEDHRQPTHAEGVFYFVYDIRLQVSVVASYQPIPPEFIARIKGVRNVGRAGKLFSFIVEEMILRQDGGALIIAESFYKTFRRSPDMYDWYGMGRFGETTVTYHFDEILAISLNPDGTIHWHSMLAKAQSSSGDYGRYSSFCLVNTGASLVFLFNDNISYRTNVVQNAIDSEGTMSRGILLSSRKHDVYLLPQYGRQISAREAVIPSIRRNKLRLLKVAY